MITIEYLEEKKELIFKDHIQKYHNTHLHPEEEKMIAALNWQIDQLKLMAIRMKEAEDDKT